MSKIDQFMDVYAPKLREVMTKHPGQFMVGYETLVVRVRNTLEQRGVNGIDINTIAWRHTAKHFGHANTYTEWRKWFSA